MPHARRAFTLVESLSTMAVAVTVMVTLTCWLTSLLRSERAGREQVTESAVRDRLARQFRQDVHLALEASVENAETEPVLRLELGDEGAIEYRPDTDGLLRIQSKAGQQQRREAYRLPASADVSFEFSQPDSPTREAKMITLRLTDGVRVDAALGWQSRYGEAEED